MVPMQVLSLEHDIRYDGKDGQADALLYDLELHEVEWAAVAFKSQTVGRHLTAILKKGDTP